MKQLQVVTLSLIAGAVIGCSSNATDLPPPTGFLHDYSKLEASARVEGARAYINPQKPLRLYKTILLEPTQIYVSGGNLEGKDVKEKELHDLAHYFDQQIRLALDESYPIVEKPAYGTLRVRAALTNVAPSLRGGGEGETTLGMSIGGAAIEAELLDSLTGEQVAAFIDSRRGRSRGLDYHKSKYSDAKLQIRQWARMLRDRLDKEKGLHRDEEFRTSRDLFRDNLPLRDD